MTMTTEPRSFPDFHAQRAASLLYQARWKQLRADGQLPVVINRRANPNEWNAWRAYFRAHNLVVQLDLMDDKPDKTVPCLHPADFNPSYAATYAAFVPDRRVKD